MKRTALTSYKRMIRDVGIILESGRRKAAAAVNQILVRTYWEIGKRIVDYEQLGKERAEYRSRLLDRISKDLKYMYGRGFSKSNVYLMRQFYIKHQNFQTVSGKLSWSHYSELLGIEDDIERGFYEAQCINEKWSIRELRRQANSALFHRFALSKDKKGLIAMSRKGQVIEKAQDIIREPYVLEFLGIEEKCSEKELEQRIIDRMQMFLLELGKGFTFVKRQCRITLGNTHYYIDLVFYNRILKCFVLIDLKIGKADHLDIGQMNMYLNYFKAEECLKEDNPPVGIILSADKDNLLVDYALGGISNHLFVSRYQLYLPNKKELEKKLKEAIENKEKE